MMEGHLFRQSILKENLLFSKTLLIQKKQTLHVTIVVCLDSKT